MAEGIFQPSSKSQETFFQRPISLLAFTKDLSRSYVSIFLPLAPSGALALALQYRAWNGHAKLLSAVVEQHSVSFLQRVGYEPPGYRDVVAQRSSEHAKSYLITAYPCCCYSRDVFCHAGRVPAHFCPSRHMGRAVRSYHYPTAQRHDRPRSQDREWLGQPSDFAGRRRQARIRPGRDPC